MVYKKTILITSAIMTILIFSYFLGFHIINGYQYEIINNNNEYNLSEDTIKLIGELKDEYIFDEIENISTEISNDIYDLINNQ